MNTIKLSAVAAALASLLVACGEEPKTEKDDARELCKAVTECENCDDKAQDAKIAALTMATEWGKSTQKAFQDGDEIAANVQTTFVADLKKYQAESGLDCSIVSLAWNPETAKAIEEAMAGVPAEGAPAGDGAAAAPADGAAAPADGAAAPAEGAAAPAAEGAAAPAADPAAAPAK